MDKIKIIDAPCGCFKTTSAINFIKKDDGKNKILYITPFLDEVQRLIEQTSFIGLDGKRHYRLRQPVGQDKDIIDYLSKRNKEQYISHFSSKSEEFRWMISKGISIATTHSLFHEIKLNKEDMENLKDYILIMDEVADVVEQIPMINRDLEILLNNCIKVEENSKVVWIDDKYNSTDDVKGKYDDIKTQIETGCVTAYGGKNGKKLIALLWLFPIEIFKSFKDIYILTYMFDAQLQKYYYDFYNIEYENIYVKDANFTTEPQKYDISIYKNLVHIIEEEKINKIGNDKTALSKSWYKMGLEDGEEKRLKEIQQLKKNCTNFFVNKIKLSTKFNLWTTFKDYAEQIKAKGYFTGFLAWNARATNNYREKTAVAYLVNIFLKPTIKKFFEQNDVEVNEDKYALSELIQFIFRSAIRDKKEITVYIPSKRMRLLLIRWLNGEFD